MELHDVVWINAPSYDELGVKHIWPLMKSDPDFMKYFPYKMAKGLTSRSNVLLERAEYLRQ